ncbi:MAG: hypothetical protein KGH71_02330 [Candidatus Micrarchaeota archaeon]|nr:hypothetical protein [Candidatus Micrarchaeota archaeon]
MPTEFIGKKEGLVAMAKARTGLDVLIIGYLKNKPEGATAAEISENLNLRQFHIQNATKGLRDLKLLNLKPTVAKSYALTPLGKEIIEVFATMDEGWHKDIAIEILYMLRKDVTERQHPEVHRLAKSVLDGRGINIKEIGLRL